MKRCLNPPSRMFAVKISQKTVECMQLCVGVQEDSSCRYYRSLDLSSCFLSSWCLVLSDFPFLQKEGIQTGNPWTQTQMKHLSAGWDNMAEGTSEDMWLMKEVGGSER